jgi:hypothetical protein
MDVCPWSPYVHVISPTKRTPMYQSLYKQTVTATINKYQKKIISGTSNSPRDTQHTSYNVRHSLGAKHNILLTEWPVRCVRLSMMFLQRLRMTLMWRCMTSLWSHNLAMATSPKNVTCVQDWPSNIRVGSRVVHNMENQIFHVHFRRFTRFR